jgi:hypothetical protein
VFAAQGASMRPALRPARGASNALWIVGTALIVIGGVVALALADRGGRGFDSRDQPPPPSAVERAQSRAPH